jgi:hypothetical protein
VRYERKREHRCPQRFWPEQRTEMSLIEIEKAARRVWTEGKTGAQFELRSRSISKVGEDS